MIRCVALDDEPLALKQMAGYISKTPFLQLVEKFTSAIEAMAFLQENPVDLLFIDIQMPDLSGMDLVKSLADKPMVVFTTAYSEYAVEGFKVDAVDYLLKPIAYADFLKAANRAQRQFEIQHQETISTGRDHLFVKSEYRMVRINFEEILYIEGMREYVRIHLLHDKPIMSLLSMKSLEAQLPENRFMRVHRSYIVNLKQIKVVERGRIIFGDERIPVSDQYKEIFQNYLDSNFFES